MAHIVQDQAWILVAPPEKDRYRPLTERHLIHNMPVRFLEIRRQKQSRFEDSQLTQKQSTRRQTARFKTTAATYPRQKMRASSASRSNQSSHQQRPQKRLQIWSIRSNHHLRGKKTEHRRRSRKIVDSIRCLLSVSIGTRCVSQIGSQLIPIPGHRMSLTQDTFNPTIEDIPVIKRQVSGDPNDHDRHPTNA